MSNMNVGSSHTLTTALNSIQADLKNYIPFAFVSKHLDTLIRLPQAGSSRDNLKLFNELHKTQALIHETTQTGLGPISKVASSIFRFLKGEGFTSVQDRLQTRLQDLKTQIVTNMSLSKATPDAIIADFTEFLKNDILSPATENDPTFKETLDTISKIAKTPNLQLNEKLELINFLKDTLTELSKILITKTSEGNFKTAASKLELEAVSNALFSNIKNAESFHSLEKNSISMQSETGAPSVTIGTLSSVIKTFFTEETLKLTEAPTILSRLTGATPDQDSKPEWPDSLQDPKVRQNLIQNLEKKAIDHITLKSITPSPSPSPSSSPIERASWASNRYSGFMAVPPMFQTSNTTVSSVNEFDQNFKSSDFDKTKPFTSIKYFLRDESSATPDQKQQVLKDMVHLFKTTKSSNSKTLTSLWRGIEKDVNKITTPKTPGILDFFKKTPPPQGKQIHDAINKRLTDANFPPSKD